MVLNSYSEYNNPIHYLLTQEVVKASSIPLRCSIRPRVGCPCRNPYVNKVYEAFLSVFLTSGGSDRASIVPGLKLSGAGLRA